MLPYVFIHMESLLNVLNFLHIEYLYCFLLQQQVEPEILSPLVGDGVGYASVCHEIQTPSNYDLGDSNSCLSTLSRSSSDAYKSQSSPLPQEAVRLAIYLSIIFFIHFIYGRCSADSQFLICTSAALPLTNVGSLCTLCAWIY